MKIKLGMVGHFGLAVREPKKSARWWRRIFDLETLFEGGDYIGLTNENITIVLMKGVPHPKTISHVSFHLPNMRRLREALAPWPLRYLRGYEDDGRRWREFLGTLAAHVTTPAQADEAARGAEAAFASIAAWLRREGAA